jgi:ABC-2 type transport system ATP-binding protein
VSVLSLEGLSKSYGAVRALRDVSLQVPQGSVYGLLGPNGSGKTSLLGVVLGILQPSGGQFRWQSGLRRGALLETPNFYPYLNGAENLRIVSELRGRGGQQIGSVLAQVGLDGYPSMPFQKYSLGMKQRLAIGATLVGDPEVVVLDEPTNGLDPAGIADVRQLIRELGQQGRTVFLASHMLDEVEKVCTHVAILKMGQLLASGPLAEVLRDEDSLELRCDDLVALETLMKAHPLRPDLRRVEGGLLSAQFPAGQITAAEVNRYCMEGGQTLDHLVLRKKTLETRFLELTD